VPTIAMAIVMGIVPNVFLRPMEPAVKKTIERVTGRSFANSPAVGDRSTDAASSRAESSADWRFAIGIRKSRAVEREPPTARRQTRVPNPRSAEHRE
jgi:hypothetical protein